MEDLSEKVGCFVISLCAALVLLLVGFLLYGRLTEKVFAPDDRKTPAIASGDTAFRSARLILSEWTKLPQKPLKNRLLITLPLLLVGALLTQLNFDVLWRYFSRSNQTLAAVALCMATAYLIAHGKSFAQTLLTALPGTFMTTVSFTYILVAPEGFRLSTAIAYPIGAAVAVLCFAGYLFRFEKAKKDRRLPIQ